MRAEVVVASNRAAAGVYEDTAGPLIVDALRELGFAVDGPVVVPDGEPVGAAIAAAAEGGARVVLTTGGTGLTPTDRTPEVTRPLLDREIPGIAEAIRAYGVAQGVPTAMLSRGLAGVARALPWFIDAPADFLRRSLQIRAHFRQAYCRAGSARAG